MIEYHIKADDFCNRENKLHVQDREAPEWEARMACILVERWGMVAANPDGEDSAGRSKLRLLTPQEVVERSIETAALTIAEIRKRGWVTTLPSFAEIEAHDKPSDGTQP